MKKTYRRSLAPSICFIVIGLACGWVTLSLKLPDGDYGTLAFIAGAVVFPLLSFYSIASKITINTTEIVSYQLFKKRSIMFSELAKVDIQHRQWTKNIFSKEILPPDTDSFTKYDAEHPSYLILHDRSGHLISLTFSDFSSSTKNDLMLALRPYVFAGGVERNFDTLKYQKVASEEFNLSNHGSLAIFSMAMVLMAAFIVYMG